MQPLDDSLITASFCDLSFRPALMIGGNLAVEGQRRRDLLPVLFELRKQPGRLRRGRTPSKRPAMLLQRGRVLLAPRFRRLFLEQFAQGKRREQLRFVNLGVQWMKLDKLLKTRGRLGPLPGLNQDRRARK